MAQMSVVRSWDLGRDRSCLTQAHPETRESVLKAGLDISVVCLGGVESGCPAEMLEIVPLSAVLGPLGVLRFSM
jgi:hypothetical protein